MCMYVPKYVYNFINIINYIYLCPSIYTQSLSRTHVHRKTHIYVGFNLKYKYGMLFQLMLFLSYHRLVEMEQVDEATVRFPSPAPSPAPSTERQPLLQNT